MATVLDKKYTAADETDDILSAITKLATDKNHRVLLRDEVDWLNTKMREIARLSRLLAKRSK